jgi:AbrB family looped-hinge helix DNA binding protein
MTLPDIVTQQDGSDRFRATMGRHGRVVIPAPLRKQLGLEEGTVLTFTEHDGELLVTDRRSAVKRLQELFRGSTRPGVDLVDELIQERRAEARSEAEWMDE